MQTLQGIVKDITFRNEENGFTVLKLEAPGTAVPALCVGTMPAVEAGETLSAAGEWELHAKFGRQFVVKTFETVRPLTREGIAALLGSGLIENIGAVRAKKIIDVFGLETLDILDKTPERLLEVRGIGKKTLEKIIGAWRRRSHIRALMLFLQECAITVNMATKIYNAYGDAAKEKISQNPYCLIDDVWGVGFKKADAIAQKLGFAHDTFKRIRAGLSYVASEAAADGHTYLPKTSLLSHAAEILEVPEDKVLFSLDHIVKEGTLVDDEDRIYLPHLYGAECAVAQALAQRAGQLNHAVRKYDARYIAAWLERYSKKTAWAPDPKQAAAVHAALSSGVSVLTGGPGTGKTTTLQVIVSFLREHSIVAALAAPTGRAAQRMGSIAGLAASTLHRLLEFRPGAGGYRFARDAGNPVDADMIIVDEVSMMDILLTRSFLAAVKKDTALLFVGDGNQLPSIGPGAVLSDMIASGKIPHVGLTTVFRQAAQSAIVRAAHDIIAGRAPEFPNDKDGNLFFIPQDDPDRCCGEIVSLVSRRLPAAYGLDARADIQVLSPIHKGVLGTQNLNALLAQALNPDPRAVRRGDTAFGVGDKVMQVRNDYDRGVFNGDIGIVSEIVDDTDLVVDFGEQKTVYEPKHLDDLVRAYCISIHKSQGCEFPAVVIPVVTQHFIMLQRNLLYTAITRARRLCVLVGSQRAVSIAVRNNETVERYSRLRERIVDAVKVDTQTC
ncbi:MAG TPA: ATP-dependent RecD-like DNA helicase [Chitinivibrionales bacterium]|nr:ATP-dependent RecD-like DNA helicase [Chitinivibrionales bacterium]